MSDTPTTPLYFFTSVGCAFCKQAEPMIDELINEGNDILKLDIAETDNKNLKNELLVKYNIQCGTPFFINADTGHHICGFRDKDTLDKWVKGEEIPPPPKPTGPPPKPPLQGASKKEEKTWVKEYDKWASENSHLPNLKTSQEVLDMPRPKSEPPKPPELNYTDEQFDQWGKDYDKWRDENDHIKGTLPSEKIVENFKQRAAQGAQQVDVPTKREIIGGEDAPKPEVIDQKDFNLLKSEVSNLNDKVDILLKHLGAK